MSALALAVVVLAVAEAGASHAAGSAPVTLYFHAADPANLGHIPMTILPPPANLTFRQPTGPTAWTFTCLGDAGGPRLESHTFRGFTYAAATNDHEAPQAIRSESRGVGYPSVFMGNLTLDWFMEAQATDAPGTPPAVVPDVVVRAVVREGATEADYETGRIIASGETPPALLAGPATEGVATTTVDGIHVYHWILPLATESPQLPESGFSVRVDVEVENPACGAATAGGALAPPLLRLHSSEGHRPSLSTEVQEPLRVVELVAEEGRGGTVSVRASMQSLWGPYAAAGIRVEATGPSAVTGTTTVLVPPPETTQRPDSPVYAFWHWPAASAVAGEYHLTVTAFDHAGNEAQPMATTVILEEPAHPRDPAKPLDGIQAMVVLVALVALARSRR